MVRQSRDCSSSRGERSEADLQQLQRQGSLLVRSAAQFRELVQSAGLEQAYGQTHVVVAANAEFTDQASLVLHLGLCDPPMRMQRCRLGGAEAWGGHGNSDLVMPIDQGGAQALEQLLGGHQLPFSASGQATSQQPRLELETSLSLAEIGAGRLLLHRGITENGVVAVSSREGRTSTAWGPVLGPLSTGLYSCSGAGSIGLTMPGLRLLGPGSPVLVAGALGWVSGSGSGHNPEVRRQGSGHALGPGACCALEADVHQLEPRWLRATQLHDERTGLLVAVAAPVPLLNLQIAAEAACDQGELQAPVLDYGIPRRVRPSLGLVDYAQLHSGRLTIDGRQISCAPAHSRRLAEEISAALMEQLQSGRFPLRLPLQPLSARPALRALG